MNTNVIFSHFWPSAMETDPVKFMRGCTVLASMNYILYGYGAGVISGAILFIPGEMNVTGMQVQALVASLMIAMIVGAALAARASDTVGRRLTMALTSLVYMVGSVLMTVAPSFAVILVGRIVSGVAAGATVLVSPLYIAEISLASTRGSLMCYPNVFYNAGLISAYVMNYAFSSLPMNLNWRCMFAVGAVPPVFMFLGVLAMPESPRWLCMRGRNDEALRVLVRTSGSRDAASARLMEILNGIQYSRLMRQDHDTADYLHSEGNGTWAEIYRPTPIVKRMLIVTLGIMFFNQAVGIGAAVNYTSVVVIYVGLTTNNDVFRAIIAVGVSKALGSLAAVFLIDRVGRRPLLLISATGVALSEITVAVSMYFSHPSDVPSPVHRQAASYVVIGGVCATAAFFGFGLGPVNWVLVSEIFPARLRAKSSSLGIGLNGITSFPITLTFISFSHIDLLWTMFFVYAVIAVLSAGFVYLFVPETKGKTLEEIAADFHQKHTRITPTQGSSHLMIWDAQTGKLREENKEKERLEFKELPLPMGVL